MRLRTALGRVGRDDAVRGALRVVINGDSNAFKVIVWFHRCLAQERILGCLDGDGDADHNLDDIGVGI